MSDPRPITHGTFVRTVDAVDGPTAQSTVTALAHADASVRRVLTVRSVRLVTPPAPSSPTARYRVEVAVEAA